METEQDDLEADADAAFRGLLQLLGDTAKQAPSYRTYRLEHVAGELVFRQTEIDAAIEAAIDAAFGECSTPLTTDSDGRRIIKLPE